MTPREPEEEESILTGEEDRTRGEEIARRNVHRVPEGEADEDTKVDLYTSAEANEPQD